MTTGIVLGIIILGILCIAIFVFLVKIIKFNVDLAKYPEKKKMLSFDDMFQNPAIAKFFKFLLLGDLAVFCFFAYLTGYLSGDTSNINSPLLVIPGTLLFLILTVFGMRQIPYTIAMRKENGSMPVVVSVFGTLFAFALLAGIVYSIIN